MMMAQVTGNQVGEYVYTISDAHIYERQYPYVERLLQNPIGPYPTMSINPDITNIFDFRPRDFLVKDYYPTGPAMDIPTPV
jgi:thymidylate synthase